MTPKAKKDDKAKSKAKTPKTGIGKMPEIVAGTPLPPLDNDALMSEMSGWAKELIGKSKAAAKNLAPERLAAVFCHARHLQNLARQNPEVVSQILAGDGDGTVKAAIERAMKISTECTDDNEMIDELRRLRHHSALAVALSDMANLADMGLQMEWLSDAADAALDAAVRYLLCQAERRGAIKFPKRKSGDLTKGCGWVVLALGKLGSRELNYSSDVDVILLHDPDANFLVDKDSFQSFHVKQTRELVRLLSSSTVKGIGWRVDLRIRPDPGATAVSIQIQAAIGYYESLARTWERAAFIRARAVAGDIAMGNRFLEDLQPFIWRRTLDYSVVDDMKTMLRQAHATHGAHNQSRDWTKFSLKTGINGIRSIEFLTHVLQLVGGGRSKGLRDIRTLDALAALERENWLEPGQADAIGALYHALRRAEHRLQMIADAHTHAFPDAGEQMEAVARFMGHEDAAGLVLGLEATTDMVGKLTEHKLFADDEGEGGDGGAERLPELEDEGMMIEFIAAKGFTRTEDINEILRSWLAGRIPATRGERARALITGLMPAILDQLAGASDPDAAFAAFARFVEGLPASVQIFSLLDHNRELARLLGDILVLSPRLADQLRRRPMLFDLVLLDEFFTPLADEETFESELRASVKGEQLEEDLETVTRLTRERRFRAEVQVLAGVCDRDALGAALTDTAEAVVKVVLELAWSDMIDKHGKIKGDMAVIAMGRLAVHELTAASDLDLVLVWDAPPDTASRGKKSIDASTYFVRLAQRLVRWLAGATGEGVLYEVDLRLRPDGEKGSLAPKVLRLEEYYLGDAWMWERISLGKARVLNPNASCAGAVQRVIDRNIESGVTLEKMRAGVHDMVDRLRPTYQGAHPWKIRKQPGGITELDLLVHGLRLVHGKAVKDRAVGTSIVLEGLEGAGVIDAATCKALQQADAMFTNLHHALRLVGEDNALDQSKLSEPVLRFILQLCGADDRADLDKRLEGHRGKVSEALARLIPPPDAT